MKRWIWIWLAAMLLTGGALAEKDTAGLLATVDGVDLPVGGALAEYEYTAEIYALYGAAQEDYGALRTGIARMYAEEQLLRAKAEELGLRADPEEVKRLARAEYDDMLAYYKESLDDGVLSDEQLTGLAGETMVYYGYTIEAFEAHYEQELLRDALMDACLSDVQVTEEELRAYYDRRVGEDRELFESDPYYYEECVSGGGTAAYAPDGFRRVRHILIPLKEAEQERMYEIKVLLAMMAGEKPEEKQALTAEREALLTELRPQAEEVLERLNEGGDFTLLMDEYGGDPGMKEEPYRTEGYLIWPGSYMEEDFLAAALALERPGEVSEPVATPYGLHIIRYESEVRGGEIPLEEISAALHEELLAEKREEAYEELTERWYREAEITLYPENLAPTEDGGNAEEETGIE